MKLVRKYRIIIPLSANVFNVTMAGIHADGVIKNEEIYNIFDTNKVLDRPLGVNLTDRSGVAGVGFWVNQQMQKKGLPLCRQTRPACCKNI